MNAAKRGCFLTIGLSVLCWTVFTFNVNARHIGVQACGINDGYTPQCNFRDISHDYPYCLIDPVCISPFARTSYQYGYGYGLDGIGDPGVIATPVLMFAWPNLFMFIVGFGGIVLVAYTCLPHPPKTYVVLFATVWYALELCRWSEAIWRYAQVGYGDRFLVQPITYLVLAGVLLPIGLSVYAQSASRYP
jgi:hypothetical protein